jgi:hypothetical protein
MRLHPSRFHSFHGTAEVFVWPQLAWFRFQSGNMVGLRAIVRWYEVGNFRAATHFPILIPTQIVGTFPKGSASSTALWE